MQIKINFFDGQILDSINGGIYEIILSYNGKSHALYIGQSFSILVRCAFHLYKLKQNPTYFGLIKENFEDENIQLTFKILELNNEKKLREINELNFIKDKNPLSQLSKSDRLKKDNARVNDVQSFLENQLISNK